MPENREIEIRSDEVQEILSHTPNWMIRWGITSIFLLILILIGISYFVKYPDIISGKMTLSTEVPPVKLVSKTSGKLTKLFIKSGESVKENDVIAEVESPLMDSAVKYLKELIASIQSSLVSSNLNDVNFEENGLVFGDVQTEYGSLKKTFGEYFQFVTNSRHKLQISSLSRQIANHNKLISISNRQLKLMQQDLKNGEENFKSEQFLYEKGMISKMEFYEKQALFNEKKQQVENLKKTNVQNQITIADYKKQLMELKFETLEKKRTLEESLDISCNKIENQLNAWQQNYRIKAPFSGRVSYLTILNENQFITSGTNIFAVVPKNNEFVATIQIPSQGYGKVKVGQLVHIKLDNYPHNEFGQLKGKVTEISLIPNANNGMEQVTYIAKVNLTEGLNTTYKKQLVFKPEMPGTAEIVTEDLRLIERIFNQFREILDK
ncbi:MAG: HlyD family secretion protein [Flavobacteriales bacterium]